jgi:hypothetical protein
MPELLNEVIISELVPTSGIDVTANTLNVKQTLYTDKTVCLQTNILDVVVPTRMLAECGNKNPF